MDSLISFSIIMLMLSLVSERVANFLKLHFQDKSICILFPRKEANNWKIWWRVKIKILAFHQPSLVAEKEREKRILILNIIIGILVAACININFFEVIEYLNVPENSDDIKIKFGWELNEIERTNLGFWSLVLGGFYLLGLLWSVSLILFNRLYENQNKQKFSSAPFYVIIFGTLLYFLIYGWNGDIKYSNLFVKVTYHAIGFFITGIFISLGSKFWHDLLDILFLAKNTRQRLSEKETFTNYSSANQITSLVNTSRYDVVEELFEKYKPKFQELEGVLSYGLNTVLDSKSRLYKKIIEIEFNSSKAQDELKKLASKGSITLNLNTFYLKDYLEILYTERLVALPNVVNPNDIDTKPPKCYAYNVESQRVRGSFGVFEKDNKYFAISNFHVFASKSEFKKFKKNKKKRKLLNRNVQFKIGKNQNVFNGEIIDYKFPAYKNFGYDYCICSISEEVFKAYQKEIKKSDTIPEDDTEMKMYGAVSKYTSFLNYRKGTYCKVEYPDFVKEMYLQKISTSKIKNVSKGDSGSVISWIEIEQNNESVTRQGLLVAKSEHYAYMFQIIN